MRTLTTTVHKQLILNWLEWRQTATLPAKLFISLIGALTIAAASQLRVYLPFTPVPITGQTMAVMFTGLLLGMDMGIGSTLLYLLMGGLGLPFFCGASGLSVFAGPTAGYLMGFVLASAVIGRISDRSIKNGLSKHFFVSLTIAYFLLVFVPGVLWLSFVTGITSWKTLLSIGIIPFIPGDLIKISITTLIAKLLYR